MPFIVTVKTTAECLRTDCNILGDNLKKVKVVTDPLFLVMYWRLKSH